MIWLSAVPLCTGVGCSSLSATGTGEWATWTVTIEADGSWSADLHSYSPTPPLETLTRAE